MRKDSIAAGYARPWVVAAGQRARLHAHLPRAATIDIVRLACANGERHPDGRPWGPEPRIERVAGATLGTHGPGPQRLLAGTQVHAQCTGLPAWPDLALVVALQRKPRGRAGAVLALTAGGSAGLTLQLRVDAADGAHLEASDGAGALCATLRLPDHDWLLIVVEPEAHGLRLRHARCRATVPQGLPSQWQTMIALPFAMPREAPDDLRLGSAEGAMPAADVRLDLVSVLPRALLAGLTPDALLGTGSAPTAWEDAARGSGCLLRAVTGAGSSTMDLAGTATITEPQRPYSGMCGVRWDGSCHDPRQAPAHYTALQLHGDTMLDAGWAPTLEWPVPADLPSGAYAFRIADTDTDTDTDTDGEEPVYVSFFVSAAGAPRARVAVWLPTFTYLAYSNATEDMRGPPVTSAPHTAEARLDALHPAHGRSLYERHADGQGVLWVGSRRPIWSTSPGHRPWGLAADTWLLDWLERSGQAFDVITDHDVHRDGAQALAPYAVVMTGHHPEYVSTPIWDGLWRYLNGGGRLMYLGGNGYYWRTAVDATADLIEVRRAEDGTRPHIAAPGESHCAFSAEYGGLWRRLGRAPQQLVGVGMAAQGFERGAPYERGADADTAPVAFAFAGIGAGSFGGDGCWGGAASGWEIDRSDADLGTPPGTWRLAHSVGHAPSMLRTKEELLSYIAPFRDSKARSDIVLAPVGAGDVFAVGSMTWIGALWTPDGRANDVSTMTANVLRRFLDPDPIPRKAFSER